MDQEVAMGESERFRIPFINQIALLAMGVLIAYLVVDFGRQVVASRQGHDELEAAEQELSAAVQLEEKESQRLEWAQSPEAVDAFARGLGLAKENEVVVVMVESAAAPVPTAEPPAAPVSSPVSAREAWWDLFFGER